MAGVAPQHRGGSNATTIGMVISIVVAVLLLGVLIWLFTLQEQLRNDAQLAQSARDRMGRDLGEARKANQSLVAGLTGNQNDASDVAMTKVKSALETIAADEKIAREDRAQLTADYGVVAVLDRLRELVGRERDSLNQFQQQLGDVQASLQQVQQTNQKLRSEFNDKAETLESKVKELEQAKQAFEAVKNGDTRALARQIEELREQLNQKERDMAKLKQETRRTFAEMNKLIDEQRVAIRDLRGPSALEAQPLAAARKPLGQVMDALPGNSLVHVDLGREDGVTLGMTFSVYSHGERVPENGRGKASIEAVSVGKRTTECKVVSPPSPDDPILRGDGVGNIVLSRFRGKAQRFCIVGDFDTDFDGQLDQRGREQVAALVKNWGGVVVDEVDAFTNFVIVGVQPSGQPVLPIGLGAADVEEPAEDETEDDEFVEDDETEEDDGSEDEEDTDDEETDEDEDEGDDEDWDEDEDEEGDEEENGEEDEDEFDAGPGGAGAKVVRVNLAQDPEVDPTRFPQARRFRSEAERYHEAVLRAQYLSIPRLTQEQFFNFIGIEGTQSDIRRLQG